VLGVIAVPAAGPELSPCAGPVAATAKTGAPSSSIDNAAAGTAILHHVEFIGHPPFFLVPGTLTHAGGLFRGTGSSAHRAIFIGSVAYFGVGCLGRAEALLQLL
jgi:hypothetical protein